MVVEVCCTGRPCDLRAIRSLLRVWQLVFFSAFYAIFRTPPHGVESQLSVVEVPINAQWEGTNTYI